ncbi:MAG: RNA polymerase factor sigma-32 [Alphaproteobacteria bacterium]|tara:strand:- start:84 stop:971 length:888 start_codon:yes stop_codon:yes gene_type:complete
MNEKTSNYLQVEKKFFSDSMNSPLLSKEQEQSLTKSWKNNKDAKALEKLILSYTKLVIRIASQFKHYGLPFTDLVQEGHIGLLLAIEKFDVDRDLRFSTYSRWWVRATIQEYVLKNWSIVKTGSSSAQKSLFFNLRRFKINGEVNHEERKNIARLLGVKEKFISDRENHILKRDASLNTPLNNDTLEEWQNFLVDNSQENIEDVFIKNDEKLRKKKWLTKALEALDEREKIIINSRHMCESPMTLEKIGKKLNISKERVRQIEAAAITKLKLKIKNFLIEKEYKTKSKKLCRISD